MSDSALRKEADAFINFFSTFELSRPVSKVSDLSDGVVLFEVLSVVDAEYFRQSSSAQQGSDNWVLQFNSLKRLYRLMTQYISEIIQLPAGGLDVPDLQAMAKDEDLAATLKMCRLTIVIGVRCERNEEFIGKIQGLGEGDQHYLMKAIEQVMSIINSAGSAVSEDKNEDDHYYRLRSEKSQIASEKQSLEKAYQTLLEEHRTLQSSYEDAVSEKEDALARARDAQRDVGGDRRLEKADLMLKAEVDQLKSDIQKSEENFAAAEGEIEKQNSIIDDLNKRITELQEQADEAAKLKDRLDEYRHAADKLQKQENVMEKYKKKLQEGAELRSHVKSLEKQNADLVDKNASLEEEFRKVAAYKPLMESYKKQIDDLEGRVSSKTQENDTLRFELEQTKTKLKITTEEREKDSETLELYQERVKELELASTGRPRKDSIVRQSSSAGLSGEGETLGGVIEGDGDGDYAEQGLGGELDDAISGTTMTDLKIQIRKLKRELQSVRQNEADASRLLVLENLLEDANRMKTRYENDYLAAHREKLVLQRDLEDIRSGKSMGDGAEAAIALRQRLNETVDQYEALRKEHTALEVKFESQSRELTIAKSDLTLINKDQLDILATLRASVNEDKADLEVDLERIKKQNKELSEKNRMQLEQVNALLLEKVNLQSEGISQREKMLLRERDIGDLKASMSGKDLPEDVKAKFLAMHEENLQLKESFQSSQEKLRQAKQFIKSQDRLFKEEAAKAASLPGATPEEVGAGNHAQIKILEDEVARYKRLLNESVRRYQKEQELMMSSLHALGMRTLRTHLGSTGQQSRPEPTSWLGTQRTTLSHTLRR